MPPLTSLVFILLDESRENIPSRFITFNNNIKKEKFKLKRFVSSIFLGISVISLTGCSEKVEEVTNKGKELVNSGRSKESFKKEQN